MAEISSSVTLNNGKTMPLLGLGTWKSKPGEVAKAVEHALKAGYRHIDGAYLYGNEKEVGEGIKASGVPREEIFVTSKLWNTKHHPDDVEVACRKTLDDLGLDYVDLYLIHWPFAYQRGDNPFPQNESGEVIYDDSLDPTDCWLEMEKLVNKGLAKSIGVSNFNSVQIADVLKKGSIKPVTNQVECHPYLNQSKLLEFCQGHDITITAYSPLGSPDRPWAKPGEAGLLDDPKIKEVAAKYSKSAAQVLIKWQIQRGVIVIPKSVNPGRIEENANVFDFKLTSEEMDLINSFNRADGRLIDPKNAIGKPDAVPPKHYPFNIEF